MEVSVQAWRKEKSGRRKKMLLEILKTKGANARVPIERLGHSPEAVRFVTAPATNYLMYVAGVG